MIKTEAAIIERKRRPRKPAAVRVSESTVFTDYHGILELFGLRRSTAYHLVDTVPELKKASISLKEKGEKRGKRLFHVPSIRAYLNTKLAEGQR